MSENESAPPRVFVSHSSADKERFVLGFATRLRQSGIDAWLDKWEMLPGDSLVKRIFDEGIKNCLALVVIVSNNSVGSKWVQEELNSGVVKAVEDNTRVITVRLDNCEVPHVLKHRLWIEVPDVTSYDAQLDEIVRAVFEKYEKPPIGPRPRYTRPDVLVFDGLTPIDSLVLAWVCQRTIEQGHSIVNPGGKMETDLGQQDISKDQIAESVAVLDQRGYVEVFNRSALLTALPPLKVLPYGFDTFAQSLDGYNDVFTQVAVHVTRTSSTGTQQIVSALNHPKQIVNHVIEMLTLHSMIKSALVAGNNYLVLSVSPELKRKLQNAT